MLANVLLAPWRGLTRACLISLLSIAVVHAQISGSNPSVGTSTKTLSPTDVFTGTLSVGVNGSSGGTLNLITGNFTATSGQAFSFAGSGSYLNYSGLASAPTLFLPSGTSLTQSGATPGYTYVYDNLNNSGTVTISSGTLYLNANLTNSGNLTVSNGAALNASTYYTSTFNNTGTANVTGANSTLTLVNLTNSGNLIADAGGLLQLAGNFTTAGLGNITISGSTPGTAQITGTLDNSGATLTKPSGGVYTLAGGTVKNGTVNSSALSFSNSSYNTLNNVTVSGDLVVAGQNNGASYSEQALTLTNNTAINGNLTVGTPNQYYGTVYLGSDFALGASRNLTLTGSDSVFGYYYSTANLTLPATANLIRTGSGYSYVYTNLANSGNIVVNGGTLYLQANLTNTNTGSVVVSNGAILNQGYSSYSFTNAGTANVTGANSTLTLYNLTNTGNVIADSGGLLQLAGTFTTAGLGNITISGSTPGTAQITGNLDNSGATLTKPSGGVYTLAGGTIKNGTVNSSALSFSNSSYNTLNNVTVSGDLVVAGQNNGTSYSEQALTLTNNTAVNGNLTVGTPSQYYGTVYLGSDFALGASRNLTLTGSDSVFGYYYSTANLTLPATANLIRTGSGYSYVYTNLANSGNIVVNGGTLYLQANLTNTNTGSVVVSNGAILNQGYSSYSFTNAGTANVTGANSTFTLVNLTNSGNLIADAGGLLQLAGNFTTAGLGNITLTGATLGTVQITGNLDASPAPLVAPSGGTYTLAGGTIKNGTVNSSALSFSNNSGSTLSNVTVNGDLVVGGQNNAASYSNQYLTLSNNTAINGNLTVGTAGQYYGTLYLGSDLALAASRSLTLTGSDSELTYYYSSQPTLTIPATANLTRTGAGYSYLYANVANSGNIVVNGGTLYLDANLTNSGSVVVSNGAALNASTYYTSTFNNTGTANVTGANSTLTTVNLTNSGQLIADSGGILQLAGNLTTASLGNITISGATPGSVQITGNLDNTGGNLTAPVGGVYTLAGGTIKNGTVNSSALGFSNNSGSTLSNVTVNGDLVVAGQNNGASYSNQYLTLANNTSINGNLTVGTVGQYYGTLYLGSDLALAASRSLTLTGSSSQLTYYYSSQPTLTIPATANLTRTGAGYSYLYANVANSGNIVVNGGTLYLDATLTNSGSVVVSNGGTLYPDYFNNTATVNVTGANSTLTLYNLANTGNLIADSGGLLQLAGNFTTAGLGNIAITGATPGAVDLTGNLDNTGTTLTAPTGGPYILFGGTIRNGTVSAGALSFSNNGGYLDNVTVNGDVALAGGPGQYLTLANGTTLNGNISIGTANQYYGALYLGSNLSLTANHTLTFTGYDSYLGWNSAQRTLTVGPTSSLLRTGAGYTYVEDHVINQGNLTLTGGTLYATGNLTNTGNIQITAGSVLSVSGTQFTQAAGSLAVDGTLYLPSTGLSISGGSVGGIGSISGNVTFTGGTLNPGNSIGTLTFAGNLTLTGGATTNMELGASTNDHLTVSGSGNSLVFGGALNILAVSTAFASGQSWNLFSFPNHSGSFASISLPYTSSGWVWDTSQLTNTGMLTLTTFVPLTVPEPSTYGLLAAGLGVIVVLRRHALGQRRGSG